MSWMRIWWVEYIYICAASCTKFCALCAYVILGVCQIIYILCCLYIKSVLCLVHVQSCLYCVVYVYHVSTVLCPCCGSVLCCMCIASIPCCVCVYYVANPYRVSYAYAILYACIMLRVSTVLCVHLWLRPPTGLEIGISAHIFYLLALQTCCIPAFCQHLCMGTRAATLLVMGWEKLQTTTLSTTELSNSECLDPHWRILEPFSGSKKETGHWGCRGWLLLSVPSPIHIWEGPTRSHSCTSLSFRPIGKTGALLHRDWAAQGLALAPELSYGMHI